MQTNEQTTKQANEQIIEHISTQVTEQNNEQTTKKIAESDENNPPSTEEKKEETPSISREKLIKKYAPYIYFHPDEQLYPSSVGWFVERSELWKVTKNSKDAWQKLSPSQKIEDVNNIKASEVNKLSNYTDAYYYLKPKSGLITSLTAQINQTIKDMFNFGKKLRGIFRATKYLSDSLLLDASIFGEPLIKNKCQAPCYAHLFTKKSGEIVLQYIFFYPYNGPSHNLHEMLSDPIDDIVDIAYSITHESDSKKDNLGLSAYLPLPTRLITFGSHVGDWEHIDIHLNRDLTIKDIFLPSHSSNYFGYYAPPQAFKWKGSHPIIYSALFGHSSYHKVIPLRIDKEDITGQGASWDTQHYIVDLDRPGQGWLNFTGQWGNSVKTLLTTSRQSPRTPPLQSWWRERKELWGHEIATQQPLTIKATTQSKYFGQSKARKMLSPLTTTIALLKDQKLSHPYFSDVFDIYGHVPNRSKQYLIYVTPDPKEKSPPEVTSFSIYQESFVGNNRPIFRDIKVSPEGTVVTHPIHNPKSKTRIPFLTYLYITDVKVKGDNKKNKSFIVNIHPLEA